MKVTNGFFNKTDKIFRYNHIYFIEYSSSLGWKTMDTRSEDEKLFNQW